MKIQPLDVQENLAVGRCAYNKRSRGVLICSIPTTMLNSNRSSAPLPGLAQDESGAEDRRSGIKRLETGQPYICGWPANRKPMTCDESVQQSLVEAASWASKALDVARQHAHSLSGNPLLLCDRVLHCSSSFTGLLCLRMQQQLFSNMEWLAVALLNHKNIYLLVI